ncbi:AT-rich interactive domain-containing protein 2-like isoform X2 [Mizuhopecten yessoensis]|uniref:AT-rich interactive domain-containing protein 2-like isoform X2 n=1 Tax=Mizuhopecten yessoensis TaxID=6573 RepID=UPI000B45CA5F|nr:AT-rich interactive domain-containing protein 2-like isoform X2 [Mizuhopecten yessoensis]
MAGILNKDPFTYQQEQNDFLKELKQFHCNRGTPITRIPRIGGKEVDLYLLYRRVIGFGGWRKVNDEDLWEQIQGDFHVPKCCSNGTQAIKHIYIRHLDKYEKVHFHGQDPDSKYVEDEGDTPARKKVCLPIYGIPSSYNYSQHRVPEPIRQSHGFSTDYVTISDYEKLEKALMSGLPNEVDFVINVCTLLSNEGKHVLRLKKSHHLLNLLMAHIGIFVPGCETLEEVYESNWRKFLHRDFIHFWYDTVKDTEAKKLIITSRNYNRKPLIGEEVLNLGRDRGRHDLEGQRVLQLAVIIRNLSFEEENATFMSSNDLVFRFLMLCIHSSYGCLRPLALDTLGNLAEKMVLIPDKEQTDMVLNLICRCLAAEDKLDVVRGLEILSKLCMKDENDVILEERLDDRIYEDVIRLLGVYDIQIIVHSLEALYQLSEIGEHSATKIAAVKRAVDFLVTLLTIEAQAYGPNSLVGIKVVEYCPPSQSAGEPSAPVSSQPMLPAQRNAPQAAALKQSVPPSCDVESTTCNWLQSAFEIKDGGDSLSQLHLYAEYITFSKKYALPQLLPAQAFLNCVKIVFPKIEMVTFGKDDGSQEIVYKGLVKKLNPPPFAVHCSGGAPTPGKNSAISSSTSMLLSSKIQAHQQSTTSVQQRTPTRPPQQLKQIQPAPSPHLSPSITVTSNHISTPVISSSSTFTSVGSAQLIQSRNVSAPQQQFQPQQVMATGGQNLPVLVIQQVCQSDPTQQGNFPVFVQEPQQKSTETRMIKTLLAKKLRHNQSGPVPICPKMDPSNPMQLLTFTTQQSNVIQEQLQHPYMVSSQGTTAVLPQFDQLSQIQGQVQVSLALDSPQSYQSQSSPSSGSMCIVQSSQLGVSNPTPQQGVTTTHQSRPVKSDRAAKKKKSGNSPSCTKSSSTNSSRSSSPKSFSPKPLATPTLGQIPPSPNPASPNPMDGDLEVCGEIERAKDVVTVGQEAMIERVENKCLDRIKNMQKTITTTPQPSIQNTNIDSGPLLVPHTAVNTSPLSSINDQVLDTGQGRNNMLSDTGQIISSVRSEDQIVNPPTMTSNECGGNSISAMVLPSGPDSAMASATVENQIREQTLFHRNHNMLQQEPQNNFSNILQGKLNGDIGDSEDSMSSDINNANNNHATERNLERTTTNPSITKDFTSEDDNVSQLESVSDMSETARAALNLEASYNDMEMNSIDDCVGEGVEDNFLCDEEAIEKYNNMDDHAEQVLENGGGESLLEGEDGVLHPPRSEDSNLKDLPPKEEAVVKDKLVEDVSAVNGIPEYQEEIIPSPTPEPILTNGVDSEDSCSGIKEDIQSAVEFKECINKFSEKVMPKMNGIMVNHVTNGERDPYEGHSNGIDYELSNDGLMGIGQENGRAEESSDNEEVKHVVIHAGEGDHVVINSQGCLEINGKVTNVENLPTTTAPNSAQDEDSEQVLAIKSILEEASEEEEEGYNNVGGQPACYDLTEEGMSMETEENSVSREPAGDPDEVIIENEMCLKPLGQTDQSQTSDEMTEVPMEETSVDQCPGQDQNRDTNPVLILEPDSCSQPELPMNEDSTDSLPVLPQNSEDNKIDIVEAAVASCDLQPQDGMDDIPCANTMTVGSIVQSIQVMPISIGDMPIGQPLLGQPLLGQPLVGQPALARLPFPTIMDINMANISNDNMFKISTGGVKVETSGNNFIYSRAGGQMDLTGGQLLVYEDDKSRSSSVQVTDVCNSRHVPTPEASRDSELSCDSVASSLTDSSSTDKHSINTAIQGIHMAVAAASTSIRSATTPILTSTSFTPTTGTKKSSHTSRSKSGEKRPKKRNRNTSGSADSRGSSASSTTNTNPPSPEFVCEWANCKRCFENSRSVFAHVCTTHLASDVDGVCLWEGCERLQRKRWSLYTHIQDHHCSELSLKAAKLRRHQAHSSGSTASTKPHTVPALVYPGDAAWQAIRRFTPKPPYPEFVEQREGPVTKHIRLTAALVLRNLARYSSLGRSLIKKHERHINHTAMSALESSNALANCLWEIINQH